MLKLIKKNQIKFIGLGFMYIYLCRKSNDLWFDNDFREIFPEIFSPYKRRYDDENDENILDVYAQLKKNEDMDIISKRRNKKSLARTGSSLTEENNYNKNNRKL